MTELIELVRRSLTDEAADQFMQRVETQADSLRAELAAGSLDNDEFTVGMELEVYAIETKEGEQALAELPDAVFGDHAAKELGLHNAELNTAPTVFDSEGLDSQTETLEQKLRTAQEHAGGHGQEFVLDAMWTLPPTEGSNSYLSAVEQKEGVTIAEKMRPDPRYVAIDNDTLAHAGGSVSLDVPGATREFPTMVFESLATSIQPHLQIPTVDAVPAYYNVGIRTLGPLLALAANSPFLPPDLYDEVSDPASLVERTHHELRIAVFEQSVNATPNPKVCVPQDIDSTTDTVDRVVEDDLYAPFLREWITDDSRAGFADRHWEFDYKRGTYWRWLRCVIGGAPVEDACDERSVRIEYRPLPTQPTISDVVGIQALTVGLIHGLVETDHPLASLPWQAAVDSFYSAAESGLDADLAWVTADGERTDDSALIYDEVFSYARAGLERAGLDSEDIDRYLAPLEARWDKRLTPSIWKKNRVRDGLEDGLAFSAAVRRMQQQYIRQSRETDSFVEWF